jgi:hypothetical protein
MIKRPTWILLAVLALVVGSYFILKNRPLKPSQSTPTTQGNTYLFTSTDGALQSLQITDAQGNKVRMQRDPNKIWVITSPTNAEADQGLATAAETQIGALRIVTAFDTSPDLSAIQLATPADIIEVVFDSGVQHKLEVGGLTPTSSGYYVRFDASKVYVISNDGIEAILNLLKSPPYPPTATPPPSDTPSAETAAPTP